MEGEHAARARRGIAFVAEKGFDAGGFVEERERAGKAGGEKGREACGVAPRLVGDDGERGANLLCLNHAESFPIHEQQVIARAGRERDFAQRDAATSGKVHLLVILNDPAAGRELRVDLLAGQLLRGFRHGKTV